MNQAGRLLRYASAWLHFGELRKLSLDTCTLEQLVDALFGYADGFFEPIQVKEEILEALRAVHALQPRYIVEIGTCCGGALLLWSRVAHPEAVIVSIDLPGGEFGGGHSALRVPLIRRLGLPKQRIHLIRGDSHQPATLEKTRQFLGEHPADFLFIDADHTEKGVRADYAMYGPLVRKGGIIGFHDIGIQNPEYGVRKLWAEISAGREHRAILGKPLSYGIGLLYC